MKAIIQAKYGSFDVLKLEDIQKPIPTDKDVLVKVYAASVNYNNRMFVTGKPFIGHLWTGLLQPKFKTPGNDIAGRVEAVGRNVEQFKPWAIGGCLLVGIGVGMFFVRENPIALVASLLVGLGVGLVIAPIISSRSGK